GESGGPRTTPLLTGKPRNAIEPERRSDMSERSAIRVLVVEDSASQAKKLRSVLEGAGYHVETASDGNEGLRVFQFSSETFDVILSDVMMPGRSGYELCREVKADPRGASTQFVLLTSLGKPIDLVRGLE